MRQRLSAVLTIAVLAVVLVSCGSSTKSSAPAGTSGPAQITIDSTFAYKVKPVTAGATVTVENDSSSQHTVTADGGEFDVTIDAGKTATFTAPAAGTYTFHCNIHSFMKGTLTVT